MSLRSSTAKCRGTAAVELALVLPVLLLVFMVAVDFARVYCYSQMVADAARMGALYLANPDVADKLPYESVEAAVMANLESLQPAPQISSRAGRDARGDDYYELTVVYPYSLICHAFGAPRSIAVSKTVRARMHPAAVAERES